MKIGKNQLLQFYKLAENFRIKPKESEK